MDCLPGHSYNERRDQTDRIDDDQKCQDTHSGRKLLEELDTPWIPNSSRRLRGRSGENEVPAVEEDTTDVNSRGRFDGDESGDDMGQKEIDYRVFNKITIRRPLLPADRHSLEVRVVLQ